MFIMFPNNRLFGQLEKKLEFQYIDFKRRMSKCVYTGVFFTQFVVKYR